MIRRAALWTVVAAGAALAAPEWVERSNRNAAALLEIRARFSPESAGQSGAPGLDDKIVDLRPGYRARVAQANREAEKTLRERLRGEKDPQVRQDLEILIDAARKTAREIELEEKYLIPYVSAPRLVYSGVRALLDDQVAPERRPAALVRLRKYAGLESGYTPVARLAEQLTREKLGKPGLLGPSRDEVEKDLSNTKFFVDGIAELFKKYGVDGYQEAHARLSEQFGAYDEFVRKEALPRSRADFRLPEELYNFSLRQYGVDLPRTELASMARSAFAGLQREMDAIAAKVAAEKGWTVSGYREVIGELKKKQLVGDEILPHFQARLASLEGIVRRENLVTLPDRPARIQLASAAESAQQPAPHMRPPPLINNKGESGVFVLPLNIPGARSRVYDDFTFEAASWTLTAHEARPGHEMQFAAMVERGVSQARSIFAFNSTNVEGWGLYAEHIVKPYLPLDGQLISLQFRLMRAARAFLDPELHMGRITPDEARRVLREDVVLSEAMTAQEVERYMFRAPAQATSYFYGYTRLAKLRGDTEKARGAKFDPRKFHDFVLAQGLLPPDLLRKAVEQATWD
jgi:hypothetical protein